MKVAAQEGGNYLSRYLNDADTVGLRQQRPISFEMIAPALCQQDCVFCSAAVRREVLERSIVIDDKEVSTAYEKEQRMKDTLDEIAELGAKGLVWSGGGDWAIYGEWFSRVLEYAYSKGITESMWISHFAGRRFKELEMDRIVRNTVSLRASVDGPDIDTYNLIRRPKNPNAFNVMKANVQGLVVARERTGAQTRIGIQMVLLKENIDKIEEMVALAEALGVDYIQIRPVELTGIRDYSTEAKGIQKYDGFYESTDVFHQIAALCNELQKRSKVHIMYRLDKALQIEEGGIEKPQGRTTPRCHGCLMQGVLQFTPAMWAELLHCYFRDDHRMQIPPGGLRKALFSAQRHAMIAEVQKTPLGCSNGCKYVDLNEKMEVMVNAQPKVREVIMLELQRSKRPVVDPNII
jgi:wyosine [tRNA(Phe)-imidazoG37] synthetase (radical SAM superfamily)